MSVFENLQPASFRGIGFLVNSETKFGGKKTVTHEFVNSDARYTEPLGMQSPKFTIEAIISGNDALARRFDLERVLDIPGIGTLVHPVYGSVQVESTTYTSSSNQTRVGEIRLSINFEASNTVTISASPAEASSPEAVSRAAEDARDTLSDELEAKYVDPESSYEITEVADKADDVYDEVLSEVSGTIEAIQEKKAEFVRLVSDSKADIFNIVAVAFTIKTEMADLISTALSIVETPPELLIAWENLTSYGVFDVFGPTNTKKRISRENNVSVLNEYVRLSALINLYESVVYKNHETDIELASDREILDNIYSGLMEEFEQVIDVENVSAMARENDFRTAIARLRRVSNNVLNQKLQNISRVVTISPGKSTIALTTYRYYGSLDNLDLIAELNPAINHAGFNENIQAVSG